MNLYFESYYFVNLNILSESYSCLSGILVLISKIILSSCVVIFLKVEFFIIYLLTVRFQHLLCFLVFWYKCDMNFN